MKSFPTSNAPIKHHEKSEPTVLIEAPPFLAGQLMTGVGSMQYLAVREDEMLEAAAGAMLALQGAGVGDGLLRTAHFSPQRLLGGAFKVLVV